LGIPLPYAGEFEIVIMVDVATGEMVGSDRVPTGRLHASLGDGTAIVSARAKWRSSQSARSSTLKSA